MFKKEMILIQAVSETSKDLKEEQISFKKSFDGNGTFDKSKIKNKKKRFFFF